MTTNTPTNSQVDAGYETSTFALGVAISSTALIGLWACACLISTLMNHGIVAVVKGLLGTIGAT